MTNRRDFLKGSIVLGGALLSRSATAFADAAARVTVAPASIDLLVLGGTGFIGPYLVRYAVARGHRVTIFTRGRRQVDLPNEVVRLIGDRNGQLGALIGKRWDAVVDDSATNPEWVRQSAQLLKDSTRQYLFTSSTGVYYPYRKRGLDESVAPHLEVADPKDGSETYGVAKARCEREVQEAFGGRAIVVRPTYIVGPGDTTDRFPYWPVRLAKGGEVLAPGRRDDPVQLIDVRDLSEWMVRLLEQQVTGVYNAVGPKERLTMPAFLTGASRAAAFGAVASLVRSATPLAMQIPHTGEMNYDAAQPRIPAAAVSPEDAMMIARLVADGAGGAPRQPTIRDHSREGSRGVGRLARRRPSVTHLLTAASFPIIQVAQQVVEREHMLAAVAVAAKHDM